MAQLSRPYQIGLAAILVLAAAWLVLVQGHSSSSPASSASAPAASAVTTTTATPSKASAKAPKAAGSAHGSGSSHIYHGAAPGVEGLTRAIAKAHGAVETSQANAKQLQEKSEQASSASPGTTTSSSAVTAPAQSTSVPTKSSAPAAKAKSAPAGVASSAKGVPALQHAVETELSAGKIVLILFWNPKGADDNTVQQAVKQLEHKNGLDIAVHLANAHQVSDFGTITRGVQVFGTPTLLVVNKHDKALTLLGVQDAYTIEQSIQEAKQS